MRNPASGSRPAATIPTSFLARQGKLRSRGSASGCRWDESSPPRPDRDGAECDEDSRTAAAGPFAQSFTQFFGPLRTRKKSFEQSPQIQPRSANHDWHMFSGLDLFEHLPRLAGIFSGRNVLCGSDAIEQMMRRPGPLGAVGLAVPMSTPGTWRPNRSSRFRREIVRQGQRQRRLPLAVGPSTTTSSGSAVAKPPSAHAPMDGVPVANQGEDQQQESNQQQAGGFRGIDCVLCMLMSRAILGFGVCHGNIVRRAAWNYMS